MYMHAFVQQAKMPQKIYLQAVSHRDICICMLIDEANDSDERSRVSLVLQFRSIRRV
jgi:hypothetical protein